MATDSMFNPMQTEIARVNMVEQQIRAWNVLAGQTLQVFSLIRREDFVPRAHRHLAFADLALPLPCDEVMLEPKVAARMLEALNLSGEEQVLQIGCGSCYLCALLALLCKSVVCVEIHPELLELASRNLTQSGIDNVTLENADGHAGYGEAESVEAILLSGSLETIPQRFFDSLKPGGRLVGIEGQAPAMQAVLYRKTAAQLQRQTLFETQVARLRHAEQPAKFVF